MHYSRTLLTKHVTTLTSYRIDDITHAIQMMVRYKQDRPGLNSYNVMQMITRAEFQRQRKRRIRQSTGQGMMGHRVKSDECEHQFVKGIRTADVSVDTSIRTSCITITLPFTTSTNTIYYNMYLKQVAMKALALPAIYQPTEPSAVPGILATKPSAVPGILVTKPSAVPGILVTKPSAAPGIDKATETSAIQFRTGDELCGKDSYFIPDHQCSSLPGKWLYVAGITEDCRGMPSVKIH